MLIYFERSGGFAGLRMETTVDTDRLPPHQAEPLKELIQEIRFFELPKDLTAPHHGPDRFHYRVTVQEGDRSHTIELSGSTVPDDLQPLLQELNSIARTQRSANP